MRSCFAQVVRSEVPGFGAWTASNYYHGSFAQVGGLRYAWNSEATTKEDTILYVEIYDRSSETWGPIRYANTYRVITNNYLANGGDGYTNFGNKALNRMPFGDNLENVVIDYLGYHGHYTPESFEALVECMGMDEHVLFDTWPSTAEECHIIESSGQKLVLNCEAGYYRYVYENGTQECELCPGGTFSDSIDTATSCTNCTPGEFQPNVGETSCSACSEGKYQPQAGATACIPCPVNTFNAETNATACVPCEAHSTTEADGANAASLCRCDPGYYQSGDALVSGGELCMPCSELSVKKVSGSQECDPCTGNTYATNGWDPLSSAFLLNYSDPLVVPTCSCASGKQPFLQDGAWSVADDGAICVDCPAYHVRVSNADLRYAESAMCAPCELGYEFIDARTPCRGCDKGWIKLSNSLACVECSDDEGVPIDGLECLGGSAYYIHQGYYLSPNAQYCDDEQCFFDRIYECPCEDACKTEASCADGGGGDACDALRKAFENAKYDVPNDLDAGRAGTGLEAVPEVMVCKANGYIEAALCGGSAVPSCAAGYHLGAAQQECVKCPSPAAVATGAVFVLILVALAMGFIYVMHASASEMTTEDTDDALLFTRKLMVAKGSIVLLIGYFQVMSQLSFIFSRDLLPDVIIRFVSSLNIINVDINLIIDAACFQHHFLPNLIGSGTVGFMFSFWCSVAQPWVVMLLMFLVYRVLCLRHAALPDIGDDIKWHHDVASTCSAVWLWLMMFLHPGISTRMLMLFKCDPVEYKDQNVNDDTELWLTLDVSTRCFDTASYQIAAIFSALTLIWYTFGFPCFLLTMMRGQRHFVKARVRTVDFFRHRDMVHLGLWEPADHDGRLLFSEIKKSESLGSKSQELAAATNFTNNNIDILLPLSSFVEQSDEDTEESEGVDQNKETISVKNGKTVRIALIKKKDAKREVIEVSFFQKEDVGDGGETTLVNVTKMDAFNNNKVFGQFCDTLEDPFFFWNIWEIVRRLLQTCVVVVVILVTDQMSAGLIFALLIAWFAGMLHLRFSPFKSDAMDRLQLTILVNQFIVQLTLAYFQMQDGNAQGIGIFILVLQAGVMSYGAHYIVPAFRPAVMLVANRLQRGYTKVEEKAKLELEKTKSKLERTRSKLSSIGGGMMGLTDASETNEIPATVATATANATATGGTISVHNPTWEESFNDLPIVERM
ncbi:hypothetical protein CYMTET_50032 [Cymbomonas tetramitiformis]|uniref:Tyrosine-protein kinase ephrin type A/B receptor-like domain-containing protein n=1 Tax=Cymbomonas tetramitiformis TaxID=36881 RepID=A0AAE0BQM0_9CHLO|nr:hypothetical protein CYMTET_50032 [Cymbomonas tetramitiformis]